MPSFIFLSREGALSDSKWVETFPWITPEMAISGGVLTRTSISGIVYNTKLVNPASAPTGYTDLIDPIKSKAWAGKMAAPIYSDWLAELTMLWPKPQVLQFAHKLADGVVGYLRYDQIERVASGEFALMASEADGPLAVSLWKQRRVELGFVPGVDPSLVYYNYLGVPKNSANPNLATLFAAFVNSAEGQAITTIGFQGHHLDFATNVAKYLAANNIKIMSAQAQYDFYTRNADPGLMQELDAILKR
jgi:ABC-type Fe3+ transport system substrate-binding protein